MEALSYPFPPPIQCFHYAISAPNGTVIEIKEKTLSGIANEIYQQKIEAQWLMKNAEIKDNVLALSRECYNRYCERNQHSFVLSNEKNRGLCRLFDSELWNTVQVAVRLSAYL